MKKPQSDFEILILTNCGQNFGHIWPCLGQNLSKLILHHTFGPHIWYYGGRFKTSTIFEMIWQFCKFGQNLEKFALSVNFFVLY